MIHLEELLALNRWQVDQKDLLKKANGSIMIIYHFYVTHVYRNREYFLICNRIFFNFGN